MRDRWESLKFPRQDGKDGEVGKIDWVTVDLAINGLKIKWLPASKNLTLIPHVEQWVQRGIVTGDFRLSQRPFTSVGFFMSPKRLAVFARF